MRPVEYPQLLRGPTMAWWRPVVSLLLFLAIFAVLSVFLLTGIVAYWAATGAEVLEDPLADFSLAEPANYVYLNASLIVLIPAAMLSTWAVHQIRPGYVSSVVGRVRWRWLGRCVLVLAPVWAVYLTISVVTDPPRSSRPEQWVALLVIGLLLTPWQAAAEEYAFRGWLAQNIGAYLARPLLAFAVPAVVAAAGFAAAHGSPDPWILADLAAFSLAASVLTWRTGGLEAAIALHLVNNVGLDVVVNTVGGFDEVLVDADTTGSPMSLAVSLLMYALAVSLVLWQARRCRVDRRFRPVADPAAQPAVGPAVEPA